MQVVIGSDHAGFELKKQVTAFLKEQKYSILDVGTDSADSCDYPDIAKKLVKEVLKKKGSEGILVCGTGIGMSMTANRYKGIRAALCTTTEMAQLTKEHNNANVLCLGARTTNAENAKAIVKTFLETEFSQQQRHQKRIEKIDQ
jgi:RpiB/LacA/LacB family sugar-phosphate isomerase